MPQNNVIPPELAQVDVAAEQNTTHVSKRLSDDKKSQASIKDKPDESKRDDENNHPKEQAQTGQPSVDDNVMATTQKQETAIPKSSTKDKTLNFAVIQVPFSVGDIAKNIQKIRTAALNAKDNGANVVVFSELAVLGYPPEDLILRPSLAERVKVAMATLAEDLKDVVVIVGYPHIDQRGTFNSLAILQGGAQKGFYHKQCLSKQGVFDEHRYFKPGSNHVLFDYQGVTIGLLIGDDIWQDEPIQALKEAGAQVVVVASASVFASGKQKERKAILSAKAKQHHLPIVYANTVGGQDDIVFDGGSMIVNRDGNINHEASRFLTGTLMAKFDKTTGDFVGQSVAPLSLSFESETYQALVVGLRDYVRRAGFKGVIIGLSGGIDSALTLCLAVDALGADKVYAVMMPYKYTSAISLEDAEAQARRLNVSYTVCPIHEAVAGFHSALAPLFAGGHHNDTTEENLQARARGTILMALSNRYGYMVVNTTNKSEAAVGYGTLYGDLVGGFAALKDVYKTDVYRLARYRNSLENDPIIPERVLMRAPSAELRPEQKDQDTLPDYSVLDGILRLYVEGDQSFKQIVEAGFDEETVAKVLHLVDINEYKRRQAPFGSKVSHRTFGRERRYPVINGWQIRQF